MKTKTIYIYITVAIICLFINIIYLSSKYNINWSTLNNPSIIIQKEIPPELKLEINIEFKRIDSLTKKQLQKELLQKYYNSIDEKVTKETLNKLMKIFYLREFQKKYKLNNKSI